MQKNTTRAYFYHLKGGRLLKKLQNFSSSGYVCNLSIIQAIRFKSLLCLISHKVNLCKYPGE